MEPDGGEDKEELDEDRAEGKHAADQDGKDVLHVPRLGRVRVSAACTTPARTHAHTQTHTHTRAHTKARYVLCAARACVLSVGCARTACVAPAPV